MLSQRNQIDQQAIQPQSRRVLGRVLGASIIVALAGVTAWRWALDGGHPSTDMWRSLVFNIGVCVSAGMCFLPSKSKSQTTLAVAGAVIAALSQLIGRV